MNINWLCEGFHNNKFMYFRRKKAYIQGGLQRIYCLNMIST